jgi:hypothetical protein
MVSNYAYKYFKIFMTHHISSTVLHVGIQVNTKVIDFKYQWSFE